MKKYILGSIAVLSSVALLSGCSVQIGSDGGSSSGLPDGYWVANDGLSTTVLYISASTIYTNTMTNTTSYLCSGAALGPYSIVYDNSTNRYNFSTAYIYSNDSFSNYAFSNYLGSQTQYMRISGSSLSNCF